MEILLNGEVAAVAEGITVAELMRQKLPQVHRAAVEVNLEVVPRSQQTSHILRAGDRVEIVRAIGGG
jgi:thiamine biosynthesis protein ThiS